MVFDKWAPASDYTQALEALYPDSYIMGEILDSFDVKDYTTRQYRERVKEYLDAHGDKVYNKDCWKYAEEEMFNWVATRLSADVRKGLDYLLVSYYEEDCNNLKPDWQGVFNRLGEIFPHAKLGFGEVGIKDADRKANYLEN